MPFTVTHIAAAIPIAWVFRWRVPLAALVIGCVIPDLPLYFPVLLSYEATHSAVGLLTHCLPVGLLVYFLFEFLLKEPLIDLLPRPIGERLGRVAQERPDFSAAFFVAVIGCLLAGSVSHLVWDAFTHRGRWGVDLFPALRTVAFEIFGRPVRWYAVAQHLSSVLFLPPLIVAASAWVGRQARCPRAPGRWRFPSTWAGSIAVLIVLAALAYLNHSWTRYQDHGAAFVLRRTVIHSGTACLILAVLYSLLMHTIWWVQERAETADTAE